MTNINRKIAEWAGVKIHSYCDSDCPCTKDLKCRDCCSTTSAYPDYRHDPAAAMGLLDVLVEKGWEIETSSRNSGHAVRCRIETDRPFKEGTWLYTDRMATLNAAIVEAVLQVIEREKP